MFVKLDPALEALNLPVGTPEEITEGMMWLEPIDNIFTKHSCDHAAPRGSRNGRSWEEVLEGKRGDYDYDRTAGSIREHGFVRPVSVRVEWGGVKDGSYDYGDGHHRLAAAIDEGFTHIPVKAYEGDYGISRDSGCWDGKLESARDPRHNSGY